MIENQEKIIIDIESEGPVRVLADVVQAVVEKDPTLRFDQILDLVKADKPEEFQELAEWASFAELMVAVEQKIETELGDELQPTAERARAAAAAYDSENIQSRTSLSKQISDEDAGQALARGNELEITMRGAEREGVSKIVIEKAKIEKKAEEAKSLRNQAEEIQQSKSYQQYKQLSGGLPMDGALDHLRALVDEITVLEKKAEQLGMNAGFTSNPKLPIYSGR